jgi:hypothetical protein
MSNSAQMSKENSKESVKLEEGVLDTPPSFQDEAVVPDDDSRYITGRKLYLINTGLIISMFVVQLDSSIISTSVVDITDQLGGYEKSSWLFTAYLITFCGKYNCNHFWSLKLITQCCRSLDDMGKALRHYGSKGSSYGLPSYLYHRIGAMCGSSNYRSTHHVPLATGCRRRRCFWSSTTHVHGAGSPQEAASLHEYGDFCPRSVFGCRAATRRWYHASRILAMDLHSQVGCCMSPERSITNNMSSVPVGIVASLALLFTLPKYAWNEPAAQMTEDRTLMASLRRLDILGALLMVGAIVLLTTGLQQAAQGYRWSSAMVLGLIVSSGPVVVAFFMWQWFATTRLINPEPVFPWRLCQNRLRMGMIMQVLREYSKQLENANESSETPSWLERSNLSA